MTYPDWWPKKARPEPLQWTIYAMVTTQMLAWGWIQYHGGDVETKGYIIFCVCMMIGQTGAGYECYKLKAWGTLVVQIYFFIFTGFGGIQRLLA